MIESNLAKISLIIVLFGGYFGGCTTMSAQGKDESMSIETKFWYQEPKNSVPKAIVVLLHGLNQNPKKMDDWAKAISENGALVVRFALYGHTGDYAQMKKVTSDIWRSQFKAAMVRARELAEEHKLPINFIGFSLGALVGLEWLASQGPSTQTFDKMVLIAPALSVPWYSRMVINSLSLFGGGFMLPSRSPVSYRANKGTSIAAYQALFSLKDALEKKKFKNANCSTLVLIDRDDELVDSRGLRKIIKDFKLSSWSLEIVDNRYAYENFGFRHLMVDEEAIGKNLWATLSEMVIRHLKLGNV